MTAPERITADRALLRFLARQGKITNEDAARIEAMLEDPALTVHDALERENVITQKDLAVALADALRLRIVDLTTYPLDANITRELKETIATRYEVVPIGIDERTIEVVTANPLDLDALKAVEFATGKRATPVVATHVEVKDALAHTYRLQESLEQFLQLVPAGESLVVNELNDDDGGDLRMIAADAELPPVIKLADKMLIEGIKTRASDIHVEPGTDSVLVRYRVDGILEEAFRFPKWIQNPLVARLKVMAKLDITERRLPQDGRIQLRYQDKTVDMRVSSLPAQHGEKITLRILDASQSVKAIDRLGFGAGDLKLIREAAKKPQGMILITGPTGSGKTTTLYALLREIFSPKTNIVTIENPIEYQLKGINQVEVNEKQGLTFGGVLRSVLRQDPDVILLGEIRDKETAQIAFQAAATGHLVLSTVHTNDAAGAVTRLIDLGLESYAVASALNLVVAQRLVRQLCPTCAKPATLDEETRRQLHLGDAEGNFKQAAGCAQCRHTGYRSRTGVYEMLPMTTAISKLIEAGAGESMVRQQARSEGVRTMLDDAADKLRSGVTSVEELLRVVQIAEAGGMQCPGCRKEISEDYSVCPHCSRTLRATCAGCTKPLNAEWVRCPYCGTAAGEAAPVEPTAAPTERRSFKALVVDDTATIRDVVQHTLEKSDLGLSVMTAENGPQALEIAARERPDIVILDISMPEMDGFEVCRRLRSEMRTAFVPVLMLTAHDSEDDIARGFGVGADDYMVKPLRREQLVARVKRILERTYGSQAVGGAAPEPRPVAPIASVAPVAPTSAPLPVDGAAYGGPDLGAAIERLTADQDALRRAVASCEARVGELASRPVATVVGDAGSDAPAASVVELRGVGAALQSAHERALGELREEASRVRALADQAMQATSTVSALPAGDPAELAAVTTALERVQSEQVRLARAVDAVREERSGGDEQCERRLERAANELEAVRRGAAESRDAWQRESQELRAAMRSLADEALRSVQSETAGTTQRLTQVLAELRAELESQRDAQMRDGVKIRAAQESAERAEAHASGAAEQLVRDLAAVQRAIAEQREQREQDARRLGSAEEAARRTRTETTAAVEQMAGEMAALRRTLAERQDGVDAVEARLSAVEESARAARAEATTSVEQMTGEMAALRRARDEALASSARLADEIGNLKRLVADQDARRAEDAARMSALETAASSGLSLEDSRAIAERAERDAIAAADAAVRAVRDEMLAAVAATREEVASLRGVVAAATAAVELQAGWEEECDRKLASVRGETAAALDALRSERADFARALEARGAEQDERARALDTRVTEQTDLTRALDARITEQAELTRALDARIMEQADLTRALDARMAALPALPDELGSAGDLRARLDDLAALTGRLEGEQHRLVAEMRGETEAGLAALRAAASERDGAIGELRARQDELVRALDERLAGAPTAPAGDEAFADVRARLDGLQTTTARLDAEQRRLAADVEERLRALMRTAAGGFDVQLALLRGKVEVLARSLRERVPVEPDAAADDALLGHRHGLLDRLRGQLSALRSSAEWAPQRVVDLLLESTLAAAVTPFRRMLQLGDGGEADAAQRVPDDAPVATDGSAAPSSDL